VRGHACRWSNADGVGVLLLLSRAFAIVRLAWFSWLCSGLRWSAHIARRVVGKSTMQSNSVVALPRHSAVLSRHTNLSIIDADTADNKEI
jgi:hypothetical protein